MKTSLSFLALALVGCGSASSSAEPDLHAVGTYVGGGSIFGPSPCTHVSALDVIATFEDRPKATEPDNGPRFVQGPGTITKDCQGRKSTIRAVLPTDVKISGPTKVKAGTRSDLFSAALVANGKTLGGEPSLDWQLGPDCNGVAEFAPVMGAQDTGGRDRSRYLETKAKGTCTVLVGAQTGSALFESFKPQTFTTKLVVTIQ